jgi:hypothetical protein
MKKVNIAIIGGSGYWSDRNHNKNILELKDKLEIQLTAIVDPTDPRTVNINNNTLKLCDIDNTVWLNPRDFQNTDELVKNLKEKYGVNLVIIASSPCAHFEYGMSCLKYGINVICDKPILSNYNASTDIVAASRIREKYNELLGAYYLARKQHPNLMFHSILRRRSLESFTKVASELDTVYKKTKAGINNMTILINGGVCKLPAELSNPGAHGYLDGVGSLSHSAYHYLDAIAWFISKAPGKTVEIVPKLNYVTRIKDYLDAQTYMPVANSINVSSESLLRPKLSKETLGCELNVGFTFLMKDKENIQVGIMSLLFNHISFTTRTSNYDKLIREPGDHKGGGRMSQSFIDVHQEGLQNWQIMKNDVALDDNTILLQGRRHPSIKGDRFEYQKYENAYDTGISMKELLAHAFKSIMEEKDLVGHSIVRELPEERLAVDIYTACYELIARDYNNESLQVPGIKIYG